MRELDERTGLYLYRKGGFHDKVAAQDYITQQETPPHDFDIIGW